MGNKGKMKGAAKLAYEQAMKFVKMLPENLRNEIVWEIRRLELTAREEEQKRKWASLKDLTRESLSEAGISRYQIEGKKVIYVGPARKGLPRGRIGQMVAPRRRNVQARKFVAILNYDKRNKLPEGDPLCKSSRRYFQPADLNMLIPYSGDKDFGEIDKSVLKNYETWSSFARKSSGRWGGRITSDYHKGQKVKLRTPRRRYYMRRDGISLYDGDEGEIVKVNRRTLKVKFEYQGKDVVWYLNPEQVRV